MTPKINTVELKSLMSKYEAARAELQRLIELQEKLEADHARSLIEGDPERPDDVVKAAGLASQLALMPATIAKAEVRVTAADSELEREARIVAHEYQKQLVADRQETIARALAAMKPFFGDAFLPADLTETFPLIQSKTTRLVTVARWTCNPEHINGDQLAQAVLNGVA